MGHAQHRQKQAPEWAEGDQGPTNDAGDGESAFIHGREFVPTAAHSTRFADNATLTDMMEVHVDPDDPRFLVANRPHPVAN
jgi:hypothetical protein